jgi:hypothetical protein
MQRVNSAGGGGDSIAFAPAAADEIAGKRVSPKICELCGKVFLRDGLQKDCAGCELWLATVADDRCTVPTIVPRRKVKGVDEPKNRRGAVPQMTAAQEAMWKVWLKEKQAKPVPKPVPKRVVIVDPPIAEADRMMPRIHAKGRRVIMTPQEAYRRRRVRARARRAREREKKTSVFLQRASVEAAAPETIH